MNKAEGLRQGSRARKKGCKGRTVLRIASGRKKLNTIDSTLRSTAERLERSTVVEIKQIVDYYTQRSTADAMKEMAAQCAKRRTARCVQQSTADDETEMRTTTSSEAPLMQ